MKYSELVFHDIYHQSGCAFQAVPKSAKTLKRTGLLVVANTHIDLPFLTTKCTRVFMNECDVEIVFSTLCFDRLGNTDNHSHRFQTQLLVSFRKIISNFIQKFLKLHKHQYYFICPYFVNYYSYLSTL